LSAPTTMTKTAGSSDIHQRVRRKNTEKEKAHKKEEKENIKRKEEGEEREKNRAKNYICHACQTLPKERKEQASGGPFKKVQYTFMGYNSKVLAKLPYGKGDEFPAFLTHKAAVDNLIVSLQRPLHDKGVRPHALSEILLELHSKR
jgi:hypothetical protein